MQPDLFDDNPSTPVRHPALADTEALQALLEDWKDRGWLRDLDAELPRTLHGLCAEPDPLVWWLTAVTSWQYSRGHSCLTLSELVAAPNNLLGLPTARDVAQDWPDQPSLILNQVTTPHLADALAASPWVGTPESEPTPLLLDEGRLYLRRLFLAEQQVKQAIAQRLQAPQTVPDDLRIWLDQLFPGDTAPEPDWQRIATAAAVQHSFSVITGGPGTGKTTTVVKLLAVLQYCLGANLRILLAAPTGKAAARLKSSIGTAIERLKKELNTEIPTEVTTLHSLLGALPNRRRFRRNAQNPLPADVVVVDEASMIDLELMAALFAALPRQCRLILLGDKNQLASVEAGSVLSDLCAGAERGNYRPEALARLQTCTKADLTPWAEAEPGLGSDANQVTIMLRHSYRFSAGSGIGQLALAVNDGSPDATDHFDHFDDITWIKATSPGAHALRDLVVEGYRHYLEQAHTTPKPGQADAWAEETLRAYGYFQVLCALRQGDWGLHNLNQRVERWLESAGLIERDGHQWYHGRPVMIQRNNYNLGLMNGDIGLCLRHPETGELRAVFPLPNGSLKWIRPSRLSDLDTVFAMTVHKSQGSEFEHCVLALPGQPNPILTRELLYTGITRARNRFTLVAGEPGVVRQAIQHRVRRSSGL